jgi:hypothetical protein
MDSTEILICLQALVVELESADNLYDAYRVSQAMQLIRAQEEELRLLRGEADRRAMKRYEQPQGLSEFSRAKLLLPTTNRH